MLVVWVINGLGREKGWSEDLPDDEAAWLIDDGWVVKARGAEESPPPQTPEVVSSSEPHGPTGRRSKRR